MLPTLNGRIQTRIFVLLVVGGIWTALISLVLPVEGDLATVYRTSYLILLAVTVLGVGWELIYHFLQQFRWEKDWPTLFGMVTAINEGVLVWLVVRLGWLPWLPGPVPLTAYLIQFLTTWVVVWLWVNGPMRVPFVHWRFRGGRLI